MLFIHTELNLLINRTVNSTGTHKINVATNLDVLSRYGENHPTNECSTDHTVNFKDCIAYKAAFKNTVSKIVPAKGPDSNTYSKTKSYAKATTTKSKSKLTHKTQNRKYFQVLFQI